MRKPPHFCGQYDYCFNIAIYIVYDKDWEGAIPSCLEHVEYQASSSGIPNNPIDPDWIKIGYVFPYTVNSY
jgi:hypothetical protein